MSAEDDIKKKYPFGAFPIHTLEAARDAEMRLKVNLRNAHTEEDIKYFQHLLETVYARWPGLKGNRYDDIKV